MKFLLALFLALFSLSAHGQAPTAVDMITCFVNFKTCSEKYADSLCPPPAGFVKFKTYSSTDTSKNRTGFTQQTITIKGKEYTSTIKLSYANIDNVIYMRNLLYKTPIKSYADTMLKGLTAMGFVLDEHGQFYQPTAATNAMYSNVAVGYEKRKVNKQTMYTFAVSKKL